MDFNSIKEKIKEIMTAENMTLKQVLSKYPHLAELHIEQFIEDTNLSEETSKNKDLLLD